MTHPLELTEALVLHDEIEPNHFRKHYSDKSIDELAGNIAEVGLIENLVVFVLPTGRYRLRAGHRRWLAIGRLIERGAWSRDKPVRVSVDPNMTASRDALVAISESIHQEAIYPWVLGAAYADLLDHGWRETEIAEKIGKSQTTVSKYVHVARGLHPKIKELLVRLPPGNLPNILKLGEIARLWDRVSDEPDFEKQKKALEKILGAPKPAKRTTAERAGIAFFATRVKELQEKVGSYHPDVQDLLGGVVLFISGEKDTLPSWQPTRPPKVQPLRASRSRVTSSLRGSEKTVKRSSKSG